MHAELDAAFHRLLHAPTLADAETLRAQIRQLSGQTDEVDSALDFIEQRYVDSFLAGRRPTPDTLLGADNPLWRQVPPVAPQSWVALQSLCDAATSRADDFSAVAATHPDPASGAALRGEVATALGVLKSVGAALGERIAAYDAAVSPA